MEETKRIFYKKGFKYQTDSDSTFNVACKPKHYIRDDFLTLNKEGVLTIKAGYAWDGPSGPTIDTRNFMRGSLVHDALYQLMRKELLSLDEKERADLELKRICLEDGMSSLRAWWVYKGLNRFGTRSTLPESKKVRLCAPT